MLIQFILVGITKYLCAVTYVKVGHVLSGVAYQGSINFDFYSGHVPSDK